MENENLNNCVIDLEGEVWKVIDHPSIGYYPNYEISNFGRVKSRRGNKERILKTEKLRGYLKAHLSCNGKVKNFQVHRLVAIMFLPNPNNFPCVNHKIEGEEGKSMNFVFFKPDGSVDLERTTIEFCDYKYNSNYGTVILRGKETRKNSDVWKDFVKKRSKQVFQYSQSGELINNYSSVKEIERQTGYYSSVISECCNTKRNTAYGFVWSYTQLTKNQISVLFERAKQSKTVYQYTIELDFVNIFSSAGEAARTLGINRASICDCCTKRLKTSHGFIWSYEPITKVF